MAIPAMKVWKVLEFSWTEAALICYLLFRVCILFLKIMSLGKVVSESVNISCVLLDLTHMRKSVNTSLHILGSQFCSLSIPYL